MWPGKGWSLWTPCPLHRCVQWVGSEHQEVWPSSSHGSRKMFLHLNGNGGGGLPGTPSPTPHPHPHPHPLEEAGPCPGSPGESCSRSVVGWLGLHNFKSGSPRLLEIAGLKGSSPRLPEPLALGCWVETCPFYTGGGWGRTSRCFIFYHWCLFPHPRLWGWGDRLGLGRGRGGGNLKGGLR